jgi:hypothetical protein
LLYEKSRPLVPGNRPPGNKGLDPAKAEALVFPLNRVLRYLPMAALAPMLL